MKLATSTLLIGSAVAFAPSLTRRSATSLAIGREGNVELGGNTWKPDRLVLDFWYDCNAACDVVDHGIVAHIYFSIVSAFPSHSPSNSAKRWEAR